MKSWLFVSITRILVWDWPELLFNAGPYAYDANIYISSIVKTKENVKINLNDKFCMKIKFILTCFFLITEFINNTQSPTGYVSEEIKFSRKNVLCTFSD